MSTEDADNPDAKLGEETARAGELTDGDAKGPPVGMDGKGRFAPGNKLGVGNPLAGRVAKLRAVILRKFTPKIAGELVDRLIKDALEGDNTAAQILFDRSVGKAGATETNERLEALEKTIATLAAAAAKGGRN